MFSCGALTGAVDWMILPKITLSTLETLLRAGHDLWGRGKPSFQPSAPSWCFRGSVFHQIIAGAHRGLAEPVAVSELWRGRASSIPLSPPLRRGRPSHFIPTLFSETIGPRQQGRDAIPGLCTRQ